MDQNKVWVISGDYTRRDSNMIDGTYTYYTIQHRKTHESDWCDPNGPLKKVPNEKWAFSSWDYFPIEPWHGSGNDYRPKYRDSYDQSHDVWQKTDSYGWWDISYAINAMIRLTKASENNEFKHKDGYGVIHQSYKYEFRIVAVTVSQKVEEINLPKEMANLPKEMINLPKEMANLPKE